jgi:hypothetical protein
MPLENVRRRALPILSIGLAAFGAAAACRGPEPPPAAPPSEAPAAAPTATPAPAMPATEGSAENAKASPASLSFSSPPSAAQPVAVNTPAAVATPASAIQPTTSNPKPAAAACGRMPGDKIEKLRWSFGQGNAECDRLETLWANVPQADLVCNSDADCTVVSTDGNCINLPLSKTAAAGKQYSKAPCGNPVSGACAGHANVPKCVAGCCGAQ